MAITAFEFDQVNIVDKETGVKIVDIHISIENIMLSRSFHFIGEGTVVEYDREYFECEPTQIIFNYIENGEKVEKVIPWQTEWMQNTFYVALACESQRFEITNSMIKACETIGPFRLIGFNE